MSQQFPFLNKTFQMCSDGANADIISWSEDGMKVVVWRPEAMETELLPRFFKHSNFCSFVRQLHNYGFKKTDGTDDGAYVFANPNFRRGRRDLLKTIKRKRSEKRSVSRRKAAATAATTTPAAGVGGAGTSTPSAAARNEAVGMLREEISSLKAQLTAVNGTLQWAMVELGRMRTQNDTLTTAFNGLVQHLQRGGGAAELGKLVQPLGVPATVTVAESDDEVARQGRAGKQSRRGDDVSVSRARRVAEGMLDLTGGRGVPQSPEVRAMAPAAAAALAQATADVAAQLPPAGAAAAPAPTAPAAAAPLVKMEMLDVPFVSPGQPFASTPTSSTPTVTMDMGLLGDAFVASTGSGSGGEDSFFGGESYLGSDMGGREGVLWGL